MLRIKAHVVEAQPHLDIGGFSTLCGVWGYHWHVRFLGLCVLFCSVSVVLGSLTPSFSPERHPQMAFN